MGAAALVGSVYSGFPYPAWGRGERAPDVLPLYVLWRKTLITVGD